MDDTGTAALAILVIGLGCLIGSLVSGWLEVVVFRKPARRTFERPAVSIEKSATDRRVPLRPLIFACPVCRRIEGYRAHRCPHPGVAIMILERDDILGSPVGLHHERVRGRLELQNLYRSSSPERDQDMGLVLFDVREAGVQSWQ